MRETTVTCDRCRGLINHGYGVGPIHTTDDYVVMPGMQTHFDFCSLKCLLDHYGEQVARDAQLKREREERRRSLADGG